MKQFLLICFFLFPALAGQAQNLCEVNDQRPVQLLAEELTRSFKVLKKQKPPIYYLSYTYTETDSQQLEVAEGGVAQEQQRQTNTLQVMARAGSPKMDNTRTLKLDADNFYVPFYMMPAWSEGDGAFKTALWRATQTAAERAQEDFSRVQIDSITSSKRADDSADFVFPPKSLYCREEAPVSFDRERIKKMLVKASARVQGKPFVLYSTFVFSVKQGSRYFVDSVGSRLKTPFVYVRLGYQLYGRTADGLDLTRGEFYDVLKESELPSEDAFLAAVEKSIQEMQVLSQAPEAEPMTAPAILKNRAMAVFVHEVLGHRVEGHRQKDDSFGKTFTDKVGQPVVSPILTIVDDPTLAYFDGTPLRGFYEYDDEGVKSRPVTIVQDGVLKNFLMSSSPIHGFGSSNGHGRSQAGRRSVARMGNTRVMASQTVPYEKLEEMLLAEIKRQYPDGRKEAVRGADMVGTPLVSFNKVLAAADDDAVFNGSCGAESGWVPVSAIAPSVLLEALEIEKTGKSSFKPPVLLPPSADEKGGK